MPTLAYVSNANKVSVVDTSTNTVINTITVEPANNATKLIAITPDGRFAYVTNLYNFVSVIDTCSNTVVDTITVGDFPVGIAVTPNGNYVYVANSGLATSVSGTVSVIDTNTNLVVQTIPVGRDPIGVAITPDSKFVYVTIAKADIVSVINTATNTVVNSIPVGDFPQGIAITPDGKFAYVANQGQSALTNTVSVIDINSNTVIKTITVGTGPSFISITPDGNFAYVTNSFDGTVSVIETNTNTVVKTVPVGSVPFGIAVTPDGNFVYVANFVSNDVSVIDTTTNTVVDTIPGFSGPLGITTGTVTCAGQTSMCIETTRIFDSCIFEEKQRKAFKIPNVIKIDHIQCEIIETKCNILDITKINQQNDLAMVKLQIKIFVRFASKCLDNGFIEVFCFEKIVNLVVPDGADVCCDINATCECIRSDNRPCSNHFDNACCIVKIAAVVKSKKLVQIQLPYLLNCDSKQCSSCEGTPVAPGKSLPLLNELSKISRIMFAAKTKPGMTSRLVAFLNVIPYTFETVTTELKQFEINLPGGPYHIENISVKNLGESTIYVYGLTIE